MRTTHETDLIGRIKGKPMVPRWKRVNWVANSETLYVSASILGCHGGTTSSDFQLSALQDRLLSFFFLFQFTMNFGILNFKEADNTFDESNNQPPSQFFLLSPSLQHYNTCFPSNSSTSSSSSSSSSSNHSQTAHTPESYAEDTIPPVFDIRTTEEPTNPRRTVRKHREPIFVTEVPQNAYKKKRTKGLSSSEEDEGLGATNKAKMTAKERRQLRNKISARNFRVRRKGKLQYPFFSYSQRLMCSL